MKPFPVATALALRHVGLVDMAWLHSLDDSLWWSDHRRLRRAQFGSLVRPSEGADQTSGRIIFKSKDSCRVCVRESRRLDAALFLNVMFCVSWQGRAMILMNDFKAEPSQLREGLIAAVRGVLESGWFILGPQVSAFEVAWAKVCGANFGVGVGNGMDAIEIALRGLDIGPGDEVITTPMTAFATVLAVLRAGATPVLADIVADTALLDPASVERCITPRTKAILLVHLYGQVRNMAQWVSLVERHGLMLIEDCAQAHLASSAGQVAGSFGLAGAYSFYPTKNLGTVGDAGMLVTRDEALADRARCLRNYGQSERYHHPEIGMNSRLDEIQAAMLTVRLEWLPSFTDRRRSVALSYQSSITNDHVELMAPPVEPENHVHHLYVIRSQHRDALAKHLLSRGVQSLIHYPVPIHKQPPCLDVRRDPAGLINSERHAAQCLSIPCHPQMSLADADTVSAAINEFRLI